jgi:tripartite-type tricarboxylate transporter receptor subunit TctC
MRPGLLAIAPMPAAGVFGSAIGPAHPERSVRFLGGFATGGANELVARACTARQGCRRSRLEPAPM